MVYIFAIVLLSISVLSFNWLLDLFIEFSLLNATLTESILLFIGLKLFILSEFILFSSCFVTYFNFRLLVLFYPLFSSLFLNSYSIPLSNLFILLYSSFSLQSASLFIKVGFINHTIEALSHTLLAGLSFLILQFKEFIYSSFSLSDYILGSIYYFTTGLHGIHVILGCYSFYLCLLFLLFAFYFILCSFVYLKANIIILSFFQFLYFSITHLFFFYYSFFFNIILSTSFFNIIFHIPFSHSIIFHYVQFSHSRCFLFFLL